MDSSSQPHDRDDRRESRRVPVFDILGDAFIPYRLWQWATTRQDDPAIVHREEIAEGVSHVNRVAYRLTNRGAKLLDEGWKRPGDAPTMFIGGFEAYSSEHPWVRTGTKDDWRAMQIKLSK